MKGNTVGSEYSIHPKAGPSKIRMVISRTFFKSGFGSPFFQNGGQNDVILAAILKKNNRKPDRTFFLRLA
jgi:hypothetical protein